MKTPVKALLLGCLFAVLSPMVSATTPLPPQEIKRCYGCVVIAPDVADTEDYEVQVEVGGIAAGTSGSSAQPETGEADPESEPKALSE